MLIGQGWLQHVVEPGSTLGPRHDTRCFNKRCFNRRCFNLSNVDPGLITLDLLWVCFKPQEVSEPHLNEPQVSDTSGSQMGHIKINQLIPCPLENPPVNRDDLETSTWRRSLTHSQTLSLP